MKARKTTAQRLGRVLEAVTRQSGRLPETPEYGSWLLGPVSESPRRRRVRIQFILTVVIVGINLLGVGVAVLLLTVAFPVPSVFSDAPLWLTFALVPGYIAVALLLGTYWITRRTVTKLRWAIKQREPSQADERNTLLTPWRVAVVVLILWGVGAALLTTLYGLSNSMFIPIVSLTVGICGVLVATGCYLLTEFALRPVAAQVLVAGRPPQRFAPGIMGRTMTVWLLGSGMPVLGIALTAFFALVLRNLTMAQFGVAVLMAASAALIFGFVLMWILSWLIATPVRVVRAALKRVEQGICRPISWYSTGPNSASCKAASTRWSPDCGNANGCVISSVATSGARLPQPQNASERSSAVKNAVSRLFSSISSARRHW
jgi:adenylate cyclase